MGTAAKSLSPPTHGNTMNNLLPIAVSSVPRIIAATSPKAAENYVNFFTSNIRNKNTRKAYLGALLEFLDWCDSLQIKSLKAVRPIHVAAFVENLTKSKSPSTTKQKLAAIRKIFDWMVTGQIIDANPAHAVRGPKHSVKKGKTPILSVEEARTLLDSIDTSTPMGLRDQALIGLMVYSFARIGAALSMRVEDVFVQKGRLWVRLHEKGGKHHEMPCHHNLEEYLQAYMALDGIRDDPKGILFRSIGRGTHSLTDNGLAQANAYVMIRRRAVAAGIKTKIGNHTFRATGITAFLTNGGTLERAATMANHSSTRTTQLYDRRNDELSLDDVERILI
jgi:integrase/recombinase XerC